MKWARHRVVGVSVGISAIEELRHDVTVLPAEELASVIIETHAVLPAARLGTMSRVYPASEPIRADKAVRAPISALS